MAVNWKQTEQNQLLEEIDIINARIKNINEQLNIINSDIKDLQDKTYYDLLTVNELEVTQTNTTSLNVSGECTTHDISADDLNAINGTFSESISAQTITCEDISATNDILCLGTIGATSASTNLTNYIFSIVYPIGSILTLISPLYNITGAYRTTPLTSQDVRYSFRGCEFQFISDKRFLYNAGLAQNGSNYEEDVTTAETGGSLTHDHKYGLRFGFWWSCMLGNSHDDIAFYDSNTWTNATKIGSTTLSYHPENYSNSGSIDLYQKLAHTSSTETLPPYRRVYMYIRTA